MPGAVKDLVVVARLLEYGAGRPVDFPAVELASGHCRLLDQRYSRITRTCNCVEGTRRLGRNARTGESNPGDVSKHRARLRELAPQVEQEDLVGNDNVRLFARRQIVRVTGIGPNGDDGRGVADEFLVGKP